MKIGGNFLKETLFQRCDSALFGAFLFVLGSVVSKFSSFILNIYLAKKIDPELFGIGFVSIALITTLSQSLNKKCFRRVALSEAAPSSGKNNFDFISLQSSINICWLSILSTSILSLVICLIWIANPPSNIASDNRLVKQFNISVILTGISSILESISEPLLFNLIRKEQVFLRSIIEILSGTSKSILLLTIALFKSSNLDILYYSIGQFIYSSVLLTSTLLACFKTLNESKDFILLPGTLRTFSNHSFFLQNHKDILKQQILTCVQSTILQETDKILVLRLFSAKEWSNYGVISNLANIVTRVLFAPIEEIATERFREVKLDPKQNKSINQIQIKFAPLRELLFFSASIGILAMCFGPPVSKNLLSLLFGPKWLRFENIQLFTANIYFLGILSIHGILEAFMLSLGGMDQISAYRRFCMVMYCMHVAVILLFQFGGCMTLLLSNGAVMLLQVFYCLLFISKLLNPTLSEQGITKVVHSLFDILIEKGSVRIYLAFILGGLTQRWLIRQIGLYTELRKLIQNDIGLLVISALVAFCSLIISLPPLLQIMKKSHTNKHK